MKDNIDKLLLLLEDGWVIYHEVGGLIAVSPKENKKEAEDIAELYYAEVITIDEYFNIILEESINE